MDTVTHGLTGWLIGRANPSDVGKNEATLAVVVGSVLPDADNVASLLGSEFYLRIHRGISHSFAGVAVSSLLVALLFYRYGKWKDLKKLYLLTLLGQLSHIALDLLNSYGTQIFQPFSDARVSLDLLFIIDLAFTGIVVLGLIQSRYRPGRARAALAALAVYVAFAGVLHLRAEYAIREAAVRHGVPVVSSWALPRLTVVPSMPSLAPVRRAEASAAFRSLASSPGLSMLSGFSGFPLPVGPFAWNGFVDDGSTYLRAEVDPIDGAIAWKERARKGGEVPEVKALASLPDVRTYLWFARFPTVYVSSTGGKTVVTFFDLRFGGIKARRPFVLRVIETPGRSPQAQWLGS